MDEAADGSNFFLPTRHAGTRGSRGDPWDRVDSECVSWSHVDSIDLRVEKVQG